jgi:hypothetical protein
MKMTTYIVNEAKFTKLLDAKEYARDTGGVVVRIDNVKNINKQPPSEYAYSLHEEIANANKDFIGLATEIRSRAQRDIIEHETELGRPGLWDQAPRLVTIHGWDTVRNNGEGGVVVSIRIAGQYTNRCEVTCPSLDYAGKLRDALLSTPPSGFAEWQ